MIDANKYTTPELLNVMNDNYLIRAGQHSSAMYCWTLELDRRCLAVLNKRNEERLAKLNRKAA